VSLPTLCVDLYSLIATDGNRGVLRATKTMPLIVFSFYISIGTYDRHGARSAHHQTSLPVSMYIVEVYFYCHKKLGRGALRS
jgi:hypothetical protein